MMHTADMLKAIAPYREDAIVIPGRGGRYWIDLTTRPNLDAPIGQRRRWQTRSRDQVINDLRKELGING
jgi:hypothetical protein